MGAISRDDRQAACLSPNRLGRSFVRHPDADAALIVCRHRLAYTDDSEILSSRSRYQNCSVARVGHRGGNFRHVICAP